jgi:hypothetical protein
MAHDSCLLFLPCLLATIHAPAAELLPGEFGDIDLGRQLIEPREFPTIRELRKAVNDPEMAPVLMLKLFTSGDNHHLPVFSGDGRRLAFQRSDAQARSSKLLLFPSLDQPEPVLISERADAYDYMFRWAVNSAAGYGFVRILPGQDGTEVCVAEDGGKSQARTPGAARRLTPALYQRTDGIWRLVYEEDGNLVHQAWNRQSSIEEPAVLAPGTSPSWSRDGYRLLMCRPRDPSDHASGLDVIVRNLRTEEETVVHTGENESIRSPCWSPDEQLVAFFVRSGGEGHPWRIAVSSLGSPSERRVLGEDVVVNKVFDSNGPVWEPSGRRIWFFSHRHQQQAYYPLIAADVETGELRVVDYPRRCTTPDDLAINPRAEVVPELAFVGHDGLPRDVFILVLNHY